jgi:hypothetical protein
MTITKPPPELRLDAHRPTPPAELVEVLDTMRAVLGAPEAMDDPHARAIYLLDETRLRAAGKETT